jgi:CRISPR/Cas system-associated exonuclease Cas4 (RecB family)
MTPVSSVKKALKLPFNSQGASYGVARGMAIQQGQKDNENLIKVLQQQVLAQWEETKLIATTRGTLIHKIIENIIPFIFENEKFLIQKTTEFCKGADFTKAVLEIIFYLRIYYQNCSEYILYSEKYNVCGTTDHMGLRQNTKTSLLDIDDWKSNEVTYDSIKIKADSIKHNNKFLLPPFDYLEDSKYIDFVFQLSIYAIFAEEMYGLRIGKLTIHNINHAGIYTRIPIPYMRAQALELLELHKGLKKLPESSSTNAQSGQAGNEDEEW